jgi:chemotaxis signal transduction protein
MDEMRLVVRAGGHLCAFGLAQGIEVMRPMPVRPMPEGGAAFVDGVCVIRGVSVPVVNLVSLLGGSDSPPARFVVVDDAEGSVALAVSEVLGIREIPADGLRDLSALLASARSDLVARLGVLDVDPLLFLRDARLVPDSVWPALRMQPAPP